MNNKLHLKIEHIYFMILIKLLKYIILCVVYERFLLSLFFVVSI